MARRRWLLSAVSLVFLLGHIAPVRAEIVKLTAPSGRALNAELRAGDRSRPSILVLHGFLQTHDFLPTQMIVDGLSGTGLTVLAPNLSLGIPNRRQSLQCEAVHKHTLAEDLAEIDRWVAWLLERGHPSVVLVGHSWGSQHALAYLESAARRPIAALIATSLVRSPVPRAVAREQSARVQQREERGRSLRPYRLSYCRKFTATPASYSSYAEFDDPKRVLQAAAALRARDFPLHVIDGSADQWTDEAWFADLRKADVQLTVIDGADHYFSSTHEFELIEKMEEILKSLGVTAAP